MAKVQSMMLLKTNAYGAGFFMPKRNRDILLDDSKMAPSSRESGIILGDMGLIKRLP